MKTLLKIAPYFLLAAIVTAIALIGRGANPAKTTKAPVAKKSERREPRRAKQEPKTAADKVVLAKADDWEISDLKAPDATESQPAAPQTSETTTAPVSPPPANPAPGAPGPAAPAPNTGPEPAPTTGPEPAPPLAPKTEPPPAAAPPGGKSVPPPEPGLPPASVVASDTVLTAGQAKSLQPLYPGILPGWTINRYGEAAAWFYPRYEKWGGGKAPALGAFEDFLRAVDGQETQGKPSFPRSWLARWRDDDYAFKKSSSA